jgi:hypothetical protein
VSKSTWHRRDILKGMSLVGAGLAAGVLRPQRRAHALPRPAEAGDRRFVIVLCASGGASIIDSVLAIRASESASAATINCFPDSLVQSIEGSPFRAVDLESQSLASINMPFSANQSNFVRKHHPDMMAVTWTRTSVNHLVGQRRAVTGNEAWNGRTLQEVNALAHGTGCLVPNAHLITGSGYTERGGDASLPATCYGEAIPDPALWPLALHGVQGIRHPVDPALLARARALRDQSLEPGSHFTQAFGQSPALAHWKELRGVRQAEVENAELIRKLMIYTDAELPLAEHGLAASPNAQLVRERFAGFAEDPLEAQAALAFLLIKYGVSVSVTLGPGFDAVIDEDADLSGGLPPGVVKNPPIAFDFSHQGHRSTQAFMWDRLLRVADGLIDLLQGQEYAGGESLWDRTLLYVASDFGRSKGRPANAEDFGSSHDLNDGVLLISPLVRGNTVLGGVDPDTAMTYGFDPRTGAPEPGRHMTEPEIYAGMVQALGIDTAGSGLPDMPAMRRA